MVETDHPLTEAAVLVPAFRGQDGDLRLVLVRRGEHGLHGGQLAFPGGRCEPEDASPLDTALREAREEVGLAGDQVTILARLPAVETLTNGFRIIPFLARIEPPRAWHCQTGEIAEVIEAKVRELTRPEARGADVVRLPDWPEPLAISFLRVGPHRLWGATFRILDPLLPRLLAGEWEL
jgi:8-oxo-dGTP pyrophosphatase MutT (NUDIX family)